MAGRSTRTKIRWQVEKSISHLEKSMEHLAKCDAIAEERSTFINDHLPAMVTMLEWYTKLLKQYYDHL